MTDQKSSEGPKRENSAASNVIVILEIIGMVLAFGVSMYKAKEFKSEK